MSVDEVRALAIRRLQIKAATQAGAVVVRTEKIAGDQYSELVEVLSAAEVKLSSIRESTYREGDVDFLHLTGQASVNLSLVRERLTYIRENEILRKELSRISEQYLNALRSPGPVVDYPLIWEHDAVISRWL